MSTRKKSNNFIQRIFKQIWRFFDVATKAVVNQLLRSLLVLKRQSRLSSREGFVLPTVIMVILVVTLLTTAIMIRSFDRSKNASNVRVDQVVLNAARPAIDRARAKIDRLFSPDETELIGSTPPESNIADILAKPRYKLGDETQIELTGKFAEAPDDDTARKLNSAWKFPVDTDNNGKFDTFTLYGIYFRNPQNDEDRPRGTTEARALPQDDGQTDNCGSGASPEAGWYSIGGQLKKAFFTYVANVPITELPTGADADKYEKYTGNKGFSALEMQLDQTRIGLDNNAVWFNDDIALSSIPEFKLNGRVHTNSNLLLGNTLPDGNASPEITFLQVSSINSCFYNPENAKIVVGGNVAAGDIGEADGSNNTVTADLFVAKRVNPTEDVAINASNKTTTREPSLVAGNSDAYAQRLGVLVQGAINLHDGTNPNLAGAPTAASVQGMTQYPKEVIDDFKEKLKNSATGNSLSVLRRSLETYFSSRIRRVSFAEVASDAAPDVAVTVNGAKQIADLVAPPGTTGTFVFASGDLTPPISWMEATEANTGLQLNVAEMMPATKPPERVTNNIPENRIGDRVLVGHNLPRRWLESSSPVTFAAEKKRKDIPGASWVPDGGQRTQTGLVEQLDDIGDTSRNGFWETAAAQKLTAPLGTTGTTPDAELSGGLRIVTGAGIYVDGTINGTGTRLIAKQPGPNTRSFLPEPTLSSEVDPDTLPKGLTGQPDYTVVWPDTMPMYRWTRDTAATLGVRSAIGTAPYEQLKGDLQMRATVVYHYTNGEEPLACVSSYYDPTDPYTADNANDISNNGISYGALASADVSTYRPLLRRQSRMVFPDGRWVNKPLYDALENVRRNRPLSFSQKAAIDAANCAIGILRDELQPDDSAVPNEAIKERAFLDGRQIKAIHRINTESDDVTAIPQPITVEEDLNNPDHLKFAPLGALADATNKPLDYNLPLEQRQPLEVRVTEIDLEKLRTTEVAGGTSEKEYLLPNSGIIYATRDDALPDISCANLATDITKAKTQADFTCPNAATDFELDPTRRPNGIRLIEGKTLARENTYRKAEKGLILASDIPVYIKGDFNLHAKPGTTAPLEEFIEPLTADGSNFYSRGPNGESDRNKDFACRQGSPSCKDVTTGDQWRAARILSDAITILSDKFRDGYRYEGDYDLNNNAGNLAVESFLNKGFWANNYATTAEWYGTNGLPRQDFADQNGRVEGSSYVMNSVTPIQRRVRSRAYKMEICTKLPISECGPGLPDWQNNAQAGTTASAIDPVALPANSLRRYNREHYPRRVAFKRDQYNQLELDANNHAQPIKPDGTAFTYGSGTLPLEAANALWFATTTTPNDPSGGIGYDANAPLYYAKDESETPTANTPIVHERQRILPGTPLFPKEIRDANPTVAALQDQTSLNGQGADDPSDYAVCTGNQTFNGIDPITPTPCTTNGQIAKVQAMRTALLGLTTAIPKALAVSSLDVSNPLPAPPKPVPPARATAKVNVFDLTLSPIAGLPNRIMRNVQLTLDSGNQSDPIFIFRSREGTGMRFETVTLTLKGVDPNNIFWLPERGGIRITTGNELLGNFLGPLAGARLRIDDGSQIKGGRFLGFAQSTIIGDIKPLITTAQPLLVPIVQLHSPTGNPNDPNGDDLSEDWLQTAIQTTVNAVLVMGDSPSRALPAPVNAEYNGGLANFPRFLEVWGQVAGVDNQRAKISGGLIQFKRSAVATAPFEAITNPATDISLFVDGTGFPNNLSPKGGINFKYRGGASSQKAPYYQPPIREWGYDVGLLSQTPDLYSRRFTVPEAQAPNEFFREVSRDDEWVSTLLCGKVVGAGGVATDFALPPGQRPSDANCPT